MRLKDRLIRMIETDGPMPVSLYMQTCLHDPQHGYYATRPGVGEDFTTAPEISQIFGELLGLWALHEWQVMGMPSPFTLMEVGPGRATLMRDALRAISGVKAGDEFLKAMKLKLVEASPALRKVQADALSEFEPDFLTQIDDVEDGPLILIANELLDCLPVRQFIRDTEKNSWAERKVGVAAGELIWGAEPLDDLPFFTPDLNRLKGFELQPGLETMALTLAGIAERGHAMRALLIDYGPNHLPPEDTLRAFHKGEQIDPLAMPGECDLTVDVDFAQLRHQGEKAGLSVHGAVHQGPFLLSLGAEARMQQLTQANPETAQAIFEAAARLVDPKDMGDRFKVICFSSGELPAPAAFF